MKKSYNDFKNMSNVLFRADSSSKIGTGHIMRDLVLAEQFKDANIIFATQALPGNINHKIKEKGYAVELLDSNGVEALDVLIKKYNITMVVIDHYGIDYAFEKQLKARTGVKLFVLDDTYERHDCDILLNHNISANKKKYEGLVPNSCEIRCGFQYALLRDEFTQVKPKQRVYKKKNVYTVLIMMGGTDPKKLNFDLYKNISTIPMLMLHFVTTSSNENLDAFRKLIKDNDNVKLHVDSKRISLLMDEADFAIVTPSVTVNEMIFMGLPFIAIKVIENQNEIYNFLRTNSLPTIDLERLADVKQLIEKIIYPNFYQEIVNKILYLKN